MTSKLIDQSQIQILRRKFPKSPRVTILEGMHLETVGDVAGAKELYKVLLKKDETHIVCNPHSSSSSSAAGGRTNVPLRAHSVRLRITAS